DKIVITASATDKGRITADEVGIITFAGENLTPDLKPSIETEMHLAVYKKRPDISAVVHAHPPLSSSFCATNTPINCSLIAESKLILGNPAVAEYALMGTSDLADSVAASAVDSNVILMENHGILTVGTSLLQAFDRIEVLESAAKITLTTGLIGTMRELSTEQLNAISDIL
ncbi:MAG: class II aldolase/adducin family protein, partial [Planctomycetota bacterium]